MNALVLATDVFSKGGISRYTIYQIKALNSFDFVRNTHVFSLNGKDPDNHFEGADQKTDYIGGGVSFMSKIKFSIKTLLFSKKSNITIILCNHVALTPLAFIIKKLFGIPYIVNVYGLEIWSGINKLEILGLKNADAIIGDCNFIIDYINGKFSIDRKKMFLLYDCVDTDFFHPMKISDDFYKKYQIPKDKKILMTIGRLAYNKGQENIIRVLKLFSSDVIYVMAGGGPKMAEWEKLAAKEGVAGQVIFTGRIPEADLVSMYNICDVFIYLSKFIPKEGGGLPLVLIEASACEKPIIASDQDGAMEAVEDNKNGFLLSPDDDEGLAGAIKNILYDVGISERMGKYGRARVLRDFSYEKFAYNFSKIISNAHKI